MRLSDFESGRNNNFNLIRMLAATGVLVSHAFPIALGTGTTQPFEDATGYTLGWISVAVFFAISGFLITRSFDRKPHLESWFAARIARLFPALIVVTTLTVLLYGPALTTLASGDYFSLVRTWTYIPRNVTLAWLQFGLPGVIADNPYPDAINGSLWTLFHEVLCYLGVLLAGLAGALGSRRRFAMVMIVYLAAFAAAGHPQIAEILPRRALSFRLLSFPFALGMALYVWRDRVPVSWTIAGLLAVAAAVLRPTPLFGPVFVAAIAYTTFVVAYRPGGVLRRYNELGDYSYGMYVYAFPVQQAAVAVAGPMSPSMNIAIALPVTLVLAILSWSVVEKPSLDRRHVLARWLGFWRRERQAAPSPPEPSVGPARTPKGL